MDIIIQEISLENDQLVIILSGSIYLEEANMLRSKLFDYIEKGHTSLVMNFSQVNYIDGSGLGMMVAVNRKASQCGGSLRIRGLNGFVKELFDLTHLSNILEVQ